MINALLSFPIFVYDICIQWVRPFFLGVRGRYGCFTDLYLCWICYARPCTRVETLQFVLFLYQSSLIHRKYMKPQQQQQQQPHIMLVRSKVSVSLNRLVLLWLLWLSIDKTMGEPFLMKGKQVNATKISSLTTMNLCFVFG